MAQITISFHPAVAAEVEEARAVIDLFVPPSAAQPGSPKTTAKQASPISHESVRKLVAKVTDNPEHVQALRGHLKSIGLAKVSEAEEGQLPGINDLLLELLSGDKS